MSDLTETQQAFADALLATGAVKFGAFRLKLHEKQPDAPLSPIYVDLRTLRSFPDALDDAVVTLVEMIAARELSFDLYADVPQAATPLVAVLSHVTRARHDYAARGEDARRWRRDQRRVHARPDRPRD